MSSSSAGRQFLNKQTLWWLASFNFCLRSSKTSLITMSFFTARMMRSPRTYLGHRLNFTSMNDSGANCSWNCIGRDWIWFPGMLATLRTADLRHCTTKEAGVSWVVSSIVLTWTSSLFIWCSLLKKKKNPCNDEAFQKHIEIWKMSRCWIHTYVQDRNHSMAHISLLQTVIYCDFCCRSRFECC